MAEPLLRLRGLCKRFGAITVTDAVSLDLVPGEIHAVIGPNGAGKTTLINQISGALPPDAGTVRFAGEDVTALPMHLRARRGLVRSFQIAQVLPDFSVLDNVAVAAQARAGSSFRFFGDAGAEPALNDRAFACLETVGLARRAGVPARALSHGEKRQLELAVALACDPKLLLLDEPMAGTGPDETERLVAMLQGLRGGFGMLLVEHDMSAVFALADRISVLVYGRVIAAGAPDEIRADPQVRAAYLGEGA